MFISPRSRPTLFSAAALAGVLFLALQLFAEEAPLSPPGPSLLGAAGQRVTVLTEDPAMVNHPAAGYLGVGTKDIDTERAAQLRLKEARGAEIVTIDHDAPAAKAGLQLHDVILAMNNQPIEGGAQLSQMLRHTPPGRTVTFLISRNGQQQSITVQLADRSALEQNAWSHHIPVPDPSSSSPVPAAAFGGNSFIAPLSANPLYTGLELDMIGPQLAGYFGVLNGGGLLVRHVDDNSPGADAGLRAGDVITRVNGKAVATTGQWLHTVHTNRGRQIHLTVIRDRRESTVIMMAGRSGKNSRLAWPGLFRQDLALCVLPGQFARQFR